MRRTGNVTVQVALGATVLLGSAAIAVDVGLGRLYKQQLKNVSEAASHAAAAQLDGTAAGLVRARDVALAVAAENPVGGEPVALDRNDTNAAEGDVVLGYWEDGAFHPSTTPMETNTVRVVARRAAVGTLFARAAFSETSMAVGDLAIAQGGGPSASDCPFPLAIPDCALTGAPDLCNTELSLTSDQVDNGAWSRPGYTQANASYIRDSLDPAVCAAASGTDDVVTLNNGQVQSAFKELADAVNMYGVSWDVEEHGVLPAQSAGSAVSPYGKALVGQIVVFDDPDDCVDTKFAGTHAILGYATVVIYDVVNQGSTKEIKARTTCAMSDGRGGGGFFGTIVPPNFVR